MGTDRSISRSERREQDTAQFVEIFYRLTGFRPVSACREALPGDFLTRTIPSPEDLVAQFGDRLLTRTRNALQRHVPRPGETDDWTYGRLIELRGFGMFCLIDVMQALISTTSPSQNPDHCATDSLGR
jgi:hypothetical protein